MQHSWDDSKKRGSFIGNKESLDKNVTLKFNEFECGSIINSIKNRFTYETFHKFENNKTVKSLPHGINPLKFQNLIQQLKITKKLRPYRHLD